MTPEIEIGIIYVCRSKESTASHAQRNALHEMHMSTVLMSWLSEMTNVYRYVCALFARPVMYKVASSSASLVLHTN
jgi:hypothetical protein